MKMTAKEYAKFAKDRAPSSKTAKNMLKAFVIGGGICAAGQGIMELWKVVAGLDMEAAASMTSITMIFIGALLTAIGVYDKLAKHAGAGTIVPITGFANAIVSPAMEFRAEGLVMGMSAKMFVIAGPVLVFGISASIIYGLILLIFRGGV